MIIEDRDWSLFDVAQDGECAPVAVHDRPCERVSALLGPDGEPLTVAWPRPKLGFDLRPRAKREVER